MWQTVMKKHTLLKVLCLTPSWSIFQQALSSVLPEPFSVDTIPFSYAASLPYSPHNQPHALIHVYITPFSSHRMSSVNHAHIAKYNDMCKDHSTNHIECL